MKLQFIKTTRCNTPCLKTIHRIILSLSKEISEEKNKKNDQIFSTICLCAFVQHIHPAGPMYSFESSIPHWFLGKARHQHAKHNMHATWAPTPHSTAESYYPSVKGGTHVVLQVVIGWDVK